jgi:integrase
LRPIVACALLTGLRKSNILNLKWESVDLEYGFIEILKQENKGHKKIQIPISEKLEEVLYDIFFASYIAPIILMKNSFNLKFIMYNSYVFVNPQTGDNYKEIKTGFNQAVKRANIEKFTFHDLRHTVGTRLGNSGIDTGVIQELLAHSQSSTTQRYVHPTPERKKQAIGILNSYC